MNETWVVVVTAEDGTVSVTGTWRSELAATLWANDHETLESGLTCNPHLVEKPGTE